MPETGEWNGEGLPPLKTDFEASLKKGKNVDTWFSVKAKAFSDDYVVFETSGTEWAALKLDYDFRPIELKQTEGRERGERIAEMYDAFAGYEGMTPDWNQMKTIYDWLKSTDRLKDKSDGNG